MIVVAATACPLRLDASSKDPQFNYENPIQSEALSDPHIVKIGKTWYMTATSVPSAGGVSEGALVGINLWSSTNLTEWKFVSVLVSPDTGHWYKSGLSTPELFPYRGQWYLTFSSAQSDQPGSPRYIGLAVANKIIGPYHVLTQDKPLIEGSGGSLFQDDDGKVYLFRNGISAIRVDLQQAATTGSTISVVDQGPRGAWDGAAVGGPEINIEAPAVFKHDNNYYLLYASNGRGYEEGFASASKITGPWLKYHNNPVYGAQDKDWAEIYKHEYTQAPDVPYTQLGGGSPFVGPDGELWFACRATLRGTDQQPRLVIAPITFDHSVIHMVATWTPQVVFLPRHFRVRLGDSRLASPELQKLAVQP